MILAMLTTTVLPCCSRSIADVDVVHQHCCDCRRVGATKLVRLCVPLYGFARELLMLHPLGTGESGHCYSV